jgi:hypothetical protein
MGLILDKLSNSSSKYLLFLYFQYFNLGLPLPIVVLADPSPTVATYGEEVH